MAKLIPYIVTFAFGFFVAMMLFNRRGSSGGEGDDESWESKFHKLNKRYRDLTGRLQGIDQGSDNRANRLRRTLWECARNLEQARSGYSGALEVRSRRDRVRAARNGKHGDALTAPHPGSGKKFRPGELCGTIGPMASRTGRAVTGSGALLAGFCAILCAVFCATAAATEPDVRRVRVSVKRVLSDEGALPTGAYGTAAQIANAIAAANNALRGSGSSIELVLVEIQDAQAASDFYVMDTGDTRRLESNARSDPGSYLWRDDAINIYIVDRLDGAGGICSFPTVGPHRNVIVLHSVGVLGGGEGWLHEIGHYFNLIHTHERDGVADTVADTPLPVPFDCGVHDGNFARKVELERVSETDAFNVLHNVMSYHCNPLVLTPLQVVRMHSSLVKHRSHVLEPALESASPVASIRLSNGPSDRQVELVGESSSVELDGSYSHAGGGGTLISFGGDPLNKHPTAYFRHAFEVRDADSIEGLRVRLLRDDGAVLYLNGVELLRSNMPTGSIQYGTAASVPVGGEEEDVFIEFEVAASVLLSGVNLFAAEVHQVTGSSSDLSFALELLDSRGRTLIPSLSVWRYDDSGTELDSTWKDAGFDDLEWSIGVAPLGYGDVQSGSDNRMSWHWTLISGPEVWSSLRDGKRRLGDGLQPDWLWRRRRLDHSRGHAGQLRCGLSRPSPSS